MARKPKRAGGRKGAAREADPSAPKATRPPAAERRAPEAPDPIGLVRGRLLDAVPDRIDVRDWPYRPGLGALPDQVVNCDRVPMILDQEKEGACTGFALAAVINFLLAARLDAGSTRKDRRLPVSARMLYEMARRYDEWPGEQYEGSSARGAMIGWVRHGVCGAARWPATLKGPEHLGPEVAAAARGAPGGAFYRVMHREVRDMHAALAEVGILYATLMVHEGWFELGPETHSVRYRQAGRVRTRRLPVIKRQGRAENGHAVALVGYVAEGFIVQNSWGEAWGDKGFALLPYEDFMLHATDVWAAQLGVPLAMDLWEQGLADTSRGMARAAPAVPLADIRPYVVDVANNGELSQNGDYWTTEADLQRLFSEIIPERARDWARRRVLLYLHGGLNDEQAAARRVIAFRDVLLENQVYPLHVMWESGAMDAVRDMIEDLLTGADARAGDAAAWLRRLRDGLVEAKDRSLELTLAGPGGAMWREMQENARLSSEHRQGVGAMQLVAKHVAASLAATAPEEAARWEMHVVAHSAGSIYAAHALPHLLGCGIPLRSLHLFAPAMTVELFRATMLPAMRGGLCPVPDTYLLSDVGERDDVVGPYGKSLLYLVSNAFEPARGTPLLGMEKFLRPEIGAETGAAVDAEVAALLAPRLVVAGAPGQEGLGPSRSDSHGGFDNDADTLNSVLRRILGATPRRPFETRDLQY